MTIRPYSVFIVEQEKQTLELSVGLVSICSVSAALEMVEEAHNGRISGGNPLYTPGHLLVMKRPLLHLKINPLLC